MTVGVSATAVANAWLTTLTASTYGVLHVGDPGTGASNVSAGTTARQQVTWSVPAAGATACDNAPMWTNGGTAETIIHVSLWSASSGGNFLFSVALSTPQAWDSGNLFLLNAASVAIAPLAA